MLKSDPMPTWAVIKTGGKQYKVEIGQLIVVDKLEGVKDSLVIFGEVLAVNGDKFHLGMPLIKNAKVSAKILETKKDDKIRVVKFKPKSRYLRMHGHRQLKTKILIEKIVAP